MYIKIEIDEHMRPGVLILMTPKGIEEAARLLPDMGYVKTLDRLCELKLAAVIFNVEEQS